MTSFHSQFIWDSIKPLWYLQFPWRFLIFVALFSSLLAGGVIDFLFRRLGKQKVFKWIIVFLPLALVIFMNQGYFRPAAYLEVNDNYYTSQKDLKWRVSGFSFEFVPKGVATRLSDIGTTKLDITKEEIAKTSYEVLKGDLKVGEVKNLAHQKIFETKGAGELRINVYHFPGWKAFVDQKEVEIKKTGKLKLITLDLPQGKHRVEVVFTNTPVRSLANLVSLGTLVILLVGGAYVKKTFG